MAQSLVEDSLLVKHLRSFAESNTVAQVGHLRGLHGEIGAVGVFAGEREESHALAHRRWPHPEQAHRQARPSRG